MSVLRAKTKDMKDMPDWIKCCPQSEAIMQAHAGEDIEIESTGNFVAIDVQCTFCGKRAGQTNAVRVVRSASNSFFAISYDCIWVEND